MDLSRRELLTASALLLARPGLASPAAPAAASACRYPDDDIEALVAALAKKEALPSDHIVTGPGP
jgi:histidinol-phosphate/aromatic aminotransferase/cobyric acid decarboxylase-like protein